MERFTISLDDKLAREFDTWIASRAYANRSEAVRDLLRAELDKAHLRQSGATHCVACLSYVYNHHERELAERLTSLHHAHHELTISATHAHLDHDHCLETVLLRGESVAVQGFADAVCAERGVHHGKLNLISVELHQPHRHPAAAGTRAKGQNRDDSQVPHVHLKPAH
jgi:CopG family nickel-responsive transcriptional regulator